MPRNAILNALTKTALVGTAFAYAMQPALAADAAPESSVTTAAPSTPPPPAKPASTLEQIWKAPTIYKNDKADVLNELRIVGRFHLDNYVMDSDILDDSDLVVRRARLGMRAKLFHQLDVNVQADLNLEGGPVYSKLTDAYAAWKFSDAATLTLGKQSTGFTLDGGTSGNNLITIDRGNINQNFGVPGEYASGVSLGGKSGKWTYKAGVFSPGADNGEFGKFNGGAVYIIQAGYDLGKVIGVKKAVLKAEYLHGSLNANSNLFRNVSDVGALSLAVDDGSWGVSLEGVLANGTLGQSDGRAVMVMPWVNLTKKVQLVTRFTHMTSAVNNGLRFSRYESVATSRRGDRYNEAYAGVNWFIHGHNLKLQSGLTYANMRDRANDGGAYDGIVWTTGLRLSW